MTVFVDWARESNFESDTDLWSCPPTLVDSKLVDKDDVPKLRKNMVNSKKMRISDVFNSEIFIS